MERSGSGNRGQIYRIALGPGDKINPLSLTYPPPPEEFLDVLRQAKTENFNPKATVGTVRAAIEAARKSLLPEPTRPLDEIKLLETLRNDLAVSVIDALIRNIPGEMTANPPEEFMNFLMGRAPRFPGGILDQLCILSHCT